MAVPHIDAEGPESEWKEQPPRSDRLARTLAAFANGRGGTLWLGVTDDGRTVGLDDEAEARRTVQEAVSQVEPSPDVTVRRHAQPERGPLLEVRVATAEDMTAVRADDGGSVVYVRDGSSSRPASSTEERVLDRPLRARLQLDAKSRRMLAELAQGAGLTLAELARACRMGQRNARRMVVPLVHHGLVLQRDGGRYALSPEGHRVHRG